MATATIGNGTRAATTAPAATQEQLDAVLCETEKNINRWREKISAAPADAKLLKMAATSMAIAECKKLVTVGWIEKYVMPLMNSALGFMTDKSGAKGDNDKYQAFQLVDPIIECLLKDFSLTGNEFNIISGRFYGAQAGYRRKVREIPGLTDLQELAGEPVVGNGNTTIRYIVRCKINGKPWELLNEEGKPGRKFTIRVNSGMGPDAIIGKAARKALKAAFEEITGTTISDIEEPAAFGDEAPAKSASLPNGRTTIPRKPVEPTPETKAEEKVDFPPQELAAGEVPNDPTPQPDTQSLAADIQDGIESATSTTELDLIWKTCRTNRAALGEEFMATTKAAWDAKYRELSPAKK